MKFTFYGHATFMIETDGKKILFDPFITGNPSAAGKVNADDIQADYILVSHGHGDHVGDLVSIAKRTNAKVISAYEIISWAEKQGVTNFHPMNFGSFNFEIGKVRYVPAMHSSVLPDGTYGGNPGGFVVYGKEKTFYYSGDTSLTSEFQMFQYYGSMDFAILPVGGNFTMDAADAVIAAKMINCKKIIGVHFDTFGYIKIDHEAAIAMFAKEGIELILPEVGKTIEL